MITFTQKPATCMSDWQADLARIKDAAATRVRHALVDLGLGNIPFLINEEAERVELESVLLPPALVWYPQLCRILNGAAGPSTMDEAAVGALESHLWHVYRDYMYGLLEGTRQVVTVDGDYSVSTWLSEQDGYHAAVRSATRVIARIDQGLRTRLDATLAALWQLKCICQIPADIDGL